MTQHLTNPEFSAHMRDRRGVPEGSPMQKAKILIYSLATWCSQPPWKISEELFPCSICKAPRGAECRTPLGIKAKYAHGPRRNLVARAYNTVHLSNRLRDIEDYERYKSVDWTTEATRIIDELTDSFLYKTLVKQGLPISCAQVPYPEGITCENLPTTILVDPRR